MKNLLSENMLRFGAKNLSESAKQELVVKSIMETIEQHGLVSVIREKLEEQQVMQSKVNDPNLGRAKKVVGMIMTATGGAGTDEQKILDALRLVSSKEIYNSVIGVIKTSPNVKKQYGRNFYLLMDLIQTDFTEQSRGMWDITGDKPWLDKYTKILTKWNPKETYKVAPGKWEI